MTQTNEVGTVLGLSGSVTDSDPLLPESAAKSVVAPSPDHDIDLKRMAEWAMNYLIRTPRPEFNYEPVFQCHPLKCPPVPDRQDVVVPCDTDARLNWEWYYMREVSGSNAGQEVEEAFHRRLLAFVQSDGTVLAHVGCYNEGDINRVYKQEDNVYHVWGATKILHALAEDYRRRGNAASRTTAQKIMMRLKRLAVYPAPDQCYFPGGMGALQLDGTIVPNFWNQQPAPIVEPLVNYFLATGDEEALAFAKAYAEGMLAGLQPDGIRFGSDGQFDQPKLGHSHATMHAVWGVAHLGLLMGEQRYLDFAENVWNWMLRRGTGTGWFPAMPDNCNETCCISDMISIAAILGQSGRPHCFDYVERYLRNYISNLQFIVTPEFEAYYRRINASAGHPNIRKGLEELKKFQGGIIGGSGLNDWENELLGGVSGFEMFGCCAPEGMRAIYTAWTNTIQRRERSALGPAGVYVNMGLARDSEWGRVLSFMPEAGRLTVFARNKDTYFLRPPHWVPRPEVRALQAGQVVPVDWSGNYVRFAAHAGDDLTLTYPLIRFRHTVGGLWPNAAPNLTMTFEWLGNMVVATDPAPTQTPLFTGRPRNLPPAPL